MIYVIYVTLTCGVCTNGCKIGLKGDNCDICDNNARYGLF